jgi:hypothetical protein
MKDGLYCECKECRKLKSKVNYANNLKKEKKVVTEKICGTCKFKKNICDFHKQIGTKDGYRAECKECRSKKFVLNYDDIKVQHRESAKNYRINNREKFNKYRKMLYKKKPHVYAWRGMLSSVLRRFGRKKENKTYEILGYSALELKEHMEKQFKDGMSWENWGEWHIDHIKPLSYFDKNEDPKIVNSLSNLQPLWAFDNISKSGKII